MLNNNNVDCKLILDINKGLSCPHTPILDVEPVHYWSDCVTAPLSFHPHTSPSKLQLSDLTPPFHIHKQWQKCKLKDVFFCLSICCYRGQFKNYNQGLALFMMYLILQWPLYRNIESIVISCVFIPQMQENVNLYGTHPFYLAMEEGGIAHGFFLLNSNAMGQSASRPHTSSGFTLCNNTQ